MSDELLVHILEKVDRIEEHVAAVRVDQAEMKTDLRYHIKRTDLLEAEVTKVKSDVSWARWITDLVRWVWKKIRP